MKKIITVLVVAVLLAVIVPAGLGCPKPPAEETITSAEEVTTPAEAATTPAVAEPPSEFEVSGTMERTQQDLDPNPKTENGQMTLEKNTDYWDKHGDLEGTAVDEYTLVVDLASGSFTFEGQGTFTGTLNGKSGSLVYHFVGSGQFTNLAGDTGVATSEATAISGTGELANLRGTSHLESELDANGSTGTYSGTSWFEEATTPVEFETSGTMETTQQDLDPNPTTENGQMTLEKNTDYWDIHGTLEGTAVAEYTMVIYINAGTFTLAGQGTFTGTVNGKSGSFVYITVGFGQFTSLSGDAGVITTDESIISGTGELANLRGGSHSESEFDANGSTGTYSGTCWFEE